MSKLIGIRPSSFKGNDGEELKGLNLYYTDPVEDGEGFMAERVFLLESKLEACDYDPVLGDEIEIVYNRFGKVSKIRKLPRK